MGLFHGTSIALTWGQHFARFTIVDFLTAAPATPSAAVPGPGPRTDPNPPAMLRKIGKTERPDKNFRQPATESLPVR